MADEATTTDAVDESTADGVTDEATATEADDQPDGAEALGDKGKQALDRMKADRNAARAEAAELRKERDALKAAAEGREAEFEAEQKQREAEKAALAKADERILKAEVRAQAASKLADPQDALRFLDLSEFEVGSDGEVDGDAIATAITDLLNDKPYLAAQGKRFQGDADGGARKDTTPAQVTRDELSRMTPEQIGQAKKEGRLSNLLGAQ